MSCRKQKREKKKKYFIFNAFIHFDGFIIFNHTNFYFTILEFVRQGTLFKTITTDFFPSLYFMRSRWKPYKDNYLI